MHEVFGTIWAASSDAAGGNLWSFIRTEPLFAALLFLMIFVAFTLVIWRILLNHGANTDVGEFLPVFQEKLTNEGLESALKYCKEESGVIPTRLYVAGLESSREGLSAMRRAMANVIELEILPDLNFLLSPILAIAKIATMVGLLGTVISMINVFTSMNASAEGSVSATTAGMTGHAGKIGLALWATALGLVTAIPLVFAHVLFKDWIHKFEIKLKSSAQRLLLLAQSNKPTATVTATATAVATPIHHPTAKPAVAVAVAVPVDKAGR